MRDFSLVTVDRKTILVVFNGGVPIPLKVGREGFRYAVYAVRNYQRHDEFSLFLFSLRLSGSGPTAIKTALMCPPARGYANYTSSDERVRLVVSAIDRARKKLKRMQDEQ